VQTAIVSKAAQIGSADLAALLAPFAVPDAFDPANRACVPRFPEFADEVTLGRALWGRIEL